MSTASTTRTIKFISKAGTYTAQIMCPSGDLYQEWEGSIADNPSIYPDFALDPPTLYFICTSSRAAEGIATPAGIDYYFNGAKIEFSGDTSIGDTFAGMFKKIAPSGNNPYYGLQILKNIAEASGYAPAVIKMVATVAYGTQSDKIQATYTIPIQKATGSAYRIMIVSANGTNFVITQKGGSVTLKAMTYQAGSLITQNLTYQWYKMGATDWVAIQGKTGQTLTVKEEDINTYGEFLVKVKRDGNEIGQDVQGVMDASDPYDIDPCPVPLDETIMEDDTEPTDTHNHVTYTPRIVKRGTNEQVLPDTLFYFVVRDAAGNVLNGNNGQTAAASGTVTHAQCVQAGGDVSIIITTAD